ncbi:MAG: FliH/SctL family protein [Bryobacteraceae bacterium]
MLCKIARDSEQADAVRWRPAGPGQPIGVKGLPASGPPPDEPLLGRRLEELERSRHAELAQARQLGFQEGFQRATAEAARDVHASAERLAQALAELAALKRRVRNEAEMELVKLALAIARRVLRRELATDPEAIQGIAHAALQRLQNRELHRVRIFPAGAEAVRACLERIGAAPGIQIVPDPSLRPGDILFETSAGELDASVETQLQEIDRGFTDRLALPSMQNTR